MSAFVYAGDTKRAPADSSEPVPQINRLIVTLIEKDERHPWHGKGLVGRGHEIAFAVDGVSGKEITVIRNQTYEFEIRSDPLHDFYLSTSPVGQGRGVLTEGVEGNFTFNGIVRFQPTASTPDVVYYQCQNHTYMGGRIVVVDKAGQRLSSDAVPKEEDVVVEEPTIDQETLAKNVRNKIAFAKLNVRSSASAKRVRQANHPEAQQKLRQAESLVSKAETLLGKGDILEARNIIDEAIRASGEAFQLVPDVEQLAKQAKADYENLKQGVSTSLESYRAYRDLDRQETQARIEVDMQETERTILKAGRLANAGDYAAANDLLRQVRRTLDTAVADLLASKTFTYERTFDSREDEYRYEQRRNEEYHRLVRTIIEKISPPESRMRLIDTLTRQGSSLRSEAEASAAKGDFDRAIEALDGSTARYMNAIRMTGVSLFGN